VRDNHDARKRLINTPLQQGDVQCRRTATALAVFADLEKTAKAVGNRVAVGNHLAKARC